MSTLGELQRWYASQCDGEWEEYKGVKIGSLDNPGWSVVIDLEGTALEGVPFEEISRLEPERDWIRCKVEGRTFQGYGGPLMLEEILQYFLRWAQRADATADD
jgi:hypothetical protein